MRDSLVISCLHVARTYLHRARFWIFGGAYLWLVWWISSQHIVAKSAGFIVLQLASTLAASVPACFVGLHVRRQFATPSARLMPGFALAHLTVAACASLLIWAAVPALSAWACGLPAWGVVSVHSIAGLMLAAAILSRRATMLLIAGPVLLIALGHYQLAQEDSLVGRLVLGELPLFSITIIGLALLAHCVAAYQITHSSEILSAASDDFAVEVSYGDGWSERWNEMFLSWRDAAIRHRLSELRYSRWWRVERWRVPGTISGRQLALAICLGATFTGTAWLLSGSVEGAVTAAMIIPVVGFLGPFAAWHMRREAMALELMRPVARGGYTLQLALALARDTAIWGAVSGGFVCAAVLINTWNTSTTVRDVADTALFMMAFSVLAFGVHLATLRQRYWLPIVVGLWIGWLLATGISYDMYIQAPGGMGPLWFTLSATVCGTTLAAGSLIHWRTADI